MSRTYCKTDTSKQVWLKHGLSYIHTHCSTYKFKCVYMLSLYRYMIFILLNDVVCTVDDVNVEFRGDPF
jgi:hypothetical protein